MAKPGNRSFDLDSRRKTQAILFSRQDKKRQNNMQSLYQKIKFQRAQKKKGSLKKS